ncbi:MAG: hypothetical protein A2Y76_00710 [Planctomycetes bacterium RBG_13_60_9]|nr:MAG: hypothetical protein A2Y76_00710 [Planctomycetes bacterium RBG_13_60_9]
MDELLQRLLDGQVQPDEMERLGKAMREDPRVRDYYIDSMLACAVIRRSSRVTGDLSKSDLIQALSDGASQGGSKRGVRHLYSIAAILILGVLVFGSIGLFHHRAQGPAIGVLAGAYEARWQRAHPRPGEPLYVGPYDLRAGVARMELGQGTSLLLEAPCQVELKSVGEVTLRSGRFAVVVSPQAQGFRVRTPTALITDLGTEFGVIVHSDGSTEAHVLKGRIGIALDPNRSRRTAPLVVNEGLAAVVDASGRTIRGGLAARADSFLLHLPSLSQPPGPSGRLNLADIVGGGDGRGTGRLDGGIDVRTGEAFSGPATAISQTWRNDFRSSPQFRGVDGVFMPNRASGPVVISSTGLLFSQCPETAGTCFGGPANSGRFYDILSREIFTARLSGISFGTSAHPALTLHPNAGITFDLDQIRQDNPDVQIDRFTAVCGIPKDVPQPRFSSADVWVLLDGIVRLHLHYPVEQNTVEKVDVPITARTRFLTLVTTCSGGADYSWIFFGDPFLEPAGAAQAKATH